MLLGFALGAAATCALAYALHHLSIWKLRDQIVAESEFVMEHITAEIAKLRGRA